MGFFRHFRHVACAFLAGAVLAGCSIGSVSSVKWLGLPQDASPPASNPTQQVVVGSLESVQAQSFVATGWCMDPDSPAQSLLFEAYVNGDRQSGTLAFSGQANLSHSSGDHGFSFVIPPPHRTRPNGSPTLSVYCRDLQPGGLQSGDWRLLSGSPRVFGSLGGVISKVRAKNSTQRSRSAPVSAVISFVRGAVNSAAQLDSLGLTVDGVPAAAVPMEYYYRSNDGSTDSIALAKVVSRPIAFAPLEERVLDVRADGVPTPNFEATPRLAEILQPGVLDSGFFLELEGSGNGLSGQRFRARLGDQSGQQVRVLESSATSFTTEVRTRFVNSVSGASPQIYPSLSATFYVTLYSGSDTAQLRLRIANDITSEPISGGMRYRSLRVVFDERQAIRFGLNQVLYGSGSKSVRADGLSEICLDGSCLGENLLTGTSSAPGLQPMSDPQFYTWLGDGQSLLVSGALTRYLDSEQSGTAASSHLAMAEAPIVALQLYEFSRQSWSGASPVGFFHERRFDESGAQQLRNASQSPPLSLCQESSSIKRTLATILDSQLVPANPGGTGDQPQFHSNGLPELGWKVLWAEDHCQLLSFLRKMEREFLRGQLYFETRGGVDQPRTVTLADRLPLDNYWNNKPFDGNGSLQVNTHNASLRTRSGSGWTPGIRTETWTCWSANGTNFCGFRRGVNELNGWNDQHMTPGFVMMAWKLTGDPLYKQLIEAFQTSVYLGYFNHWSNGEGGSGSWMRVSAHRAFGRMIETAIALIRASDGTERAQVLREGIARKLQVMAIPYQQGLLSSYPNPMTGLGVGFAPETAVVQSISFCSSGLHSIAGQPFPQNCAWYAANGASGQWVGYPPVLCTPMPAAGANCPTRYFTHWQYGFVMNAMTQLIEMGIASNEARQMIGAYMDRVRLLHAPDGMPYPLVLHDDPNDRFTSGYHVWWMLAGAYAATYVKEHPEWPFFRDIVIPWHKQNSNPGVPASTGTATSRKDAFWLNLDH
ncbi:MAG: hypothetical protein ACK5QT_01355 [Oligoflexia bacterium]